MVRLEKTATAVIVIIDSNLLIEDVDAFEHALTQNKSAGMKRYIFDFTGTDYICSYALGVIAQTLKNALESGGAVRFCGVGRKLHTIFETMKFTSIVSIDSTRAAAVKALAAP